MWDIGGILGGILVVVVCQYSIIITVIVIIGVGGVTVLSELLLSGVGIVPTLSKRGQRWLIRHSPRVIRSRLKPIGCRWRKIRRAADYRTYKTNNKEQKREQTVLAARGGNEQLHRPLTAIVLRLAPFDGST